MDKKLTLSLNQKVIEQAKKYAKRNGTSLSKMIESYFQSITNDQQNENDIKITPLVKSLCGVGKLPEGFDYKKSRISYLENKYK
jgi:hypothetical protein